MNKYGAQRVGGFGSKLEYAVYALLKERERSGEISEIKCQQTIELQPGGRETRITWRADFTFVKAGELWACEAKGFETEVWKIKLKMLRHQKIKTEIWSGSAARPYLDEVIK